MKMNIFLKGAALSIAATATLAASAEPYDYSTKAINAYDHNGNLIGSQMAYDISYIEIEDMNLVPETFLIGNVYFSMIPVIGTNSYTLQASSLQWPEEEKRSTIATFYIGQTEVTNALWKTVMGTVPSQTNKGDNYPAVNIKWEDACSFIDKLNELLKDKLDGREFCIPNEWEWEYAAHGGNLYDKFTYSGSNTIDDVAWYKGNSNTTHEVAQKQPNGLGIYDMSGNVYEICNDPVIDNLGVTAALHSILRGGSYSADADRARNSARYGVDMIANSFNDVGLRLALKKKRTETETFTVKGTDGAQVKFNMIPVIGTSSYKLKSTLLEWPEIEKYSDLNTFYLGETEVTNALWKAVMGSVPSSCNKGDNYPVETVSWNDICKTGGFLDMLNDMLKDQLNGRKFCLPTEWEWEYAACGGQHHDKFIYSGSDNINDVAWYQDNANNTTHEVAQKQPNKLGIYDMTGNVSEIICSEAKLPDGTVNEAMHLVRGGNLNTDTSISARSGGDLSKGYRDVGFRLALK